MQKNSSEHIRAWHTNPSASYDEATHGKVEKFIHFWALVGRTLVANRCLGRAAALAYTTLLSVIPLVAVALSFTMSFLKTDTHRLDSWIKATVSRIAPAVGLVPATGNEDAQQKILDYVHNAINAVNSGTLQTTAVIALLFVGISLLSNIEATLNDIWGVQRGRSWFNRIVLYWSTITLVPLLLLLAVGLSAGPYFRATQDIIDSMPTLGTFFYSVLPILVLIITFSLFYVLMPNTRVRPDAALIGGVLAGVLVHLNNKFSSLYLGQVIQSTTVYGGLAVLHVCSSSASIFYG